MIRRAFSSPPTGTVDRIGISMEVQQYAATLEALQEANPRARAFRRAFDQP